MALNKPNLNTDLIAKESTVEEIKLSNESIKAIADEILSRMGLTNDTGGGTTAGSVFAKLNALLSAGSGGITGFKYMDKTTTSTYGTTYTTQASGILLTDYDGVRIESGGATVRSYYVEGDYGNVDESFIGFFQKGAKISIEKNNHAHIFEFI